MPTRITIDRAADLPPVELEAIHRFLIGIFMPGPGEAYAHTDAYVRVWEGDQWVSLVEIVDHTVRVGAESVRVGGIGGVSTRPEWCGRGCSTAALEAAARYLFEEMRVPFGLLFCGDPMVPFYAARGWQRLDTPVYFEWFGARTRQEDGATMILPRGDAIWPPGEVDLCGPPW